MAFLILSLDTEWGYELPEVSSQEEPNFIFNLWDIYIFLLSHHLMYI